MENNLITKVAVSHVAPVFMNRTQTVAKAVSFIEEAAKNGAQLVTFPESFIPGFPIWLALWAPIDNHDLFKRIVEESIYIDGPEIKTLSAAAKKNNIFVSVGISEKSHSSVGCVWNSNVLFDDQGQILNHHRKLMPTFYEKLIWAPGDGAGLKVSKTRIGNIGNLICGENTNPLARYTLMTQSEQIHISSWPPIWPTKRPASGDNYDNLAANKIRASAHSFEAKAFGIVSASVLDAYTRDFLISRDASVADILDKTPKAASFFVDPTGAVTGEFAQDEEKIIYAEFDLSKCVEPKQFHDVVGYYNRFDVFDLRVSNKRIEPISWVTESSQSHEHDSANIDRVALSNAG